MARPPLSTRPRADSRVRVQPSMVASMPSREKRAASNGTVVFVATWPPRAVPKATAHASATALAGARSPAQMVHLSHTARRPRGSFALRNQLSRCPCPPFARAAAARAS
jgi:hypothetical protein